VDAAHFSDFDAALLYYDSMTLEKHEKPVYVRIREVIADAILAGRYNDGDPLPSVARLPPSKAPIR
jgi:hypothetical protein